MEDLVAAQKMAVTQSQKRLLNTFAAVPDDKLAWKPSPTAKSALTVAAHVGISNAFFAKALQGELQPVDSFESVAAIRKPMEEAITTRQAAVDSITTSTQQILAALDMLTPARLAETMDFGFMQMPVAVVACIPAEHLSNHACQIDYIQTIYGDMEMHW